jgi:predicted pyridoxine 5'-phosphate oxidase superfamily flavin-nucleotide-binding protein
MAAVNDVTDEDELRGLLGWFARSESAVQAAQPVAFRSIPSGWLPRRSVSWRPPTPTADCDVSRKGDPPGFVLVIDDRTIALPERPGNSRGDACATFSNA